MHEIPLGVLTFTLVVTLLALVTRGARQLLLPRRPAQVRVRGGRAFRAQTGDRLLHALHEGGVFLPSPCGAKGTCGQCRVLVVGSAGPVLPVERVHLDARELAAGARLACQVQLRGDLEVELPAGALGAGRFACTVRSARNVTTLLRELVLDLPAGEQVDFCPGAYVQLVAPPHTTRFSELEIDPEYRAEWDRLGLRRLSVSSAVEHTRAYSIASLPAERERLTLIVRIALPPPGNGPEVPPGVVSSYLFGLRAGDRVEAVGPHAGNFQMTEGSREVLLIGGGAGMAPLRSMVLDLLLTRGSERVISYWYGARSRRELCYGEQFEQLAREHPNFGWHVALSEPQEGDAWEGDTGFIHEVVHRRYLASHPAPGECEYYLCGPPLMIGATRAMLERLGVDPERVFCDDFGG